MTSTILPPGAVYALTDIRAHDVKYPGYNQVLVPAYVARPAAPGRHPGLIVVLGIHGHEEHMKDVARRFAIHGYVALLPALYCREEFLAVVEEEDLQKAAVWLRERPNAQTIGDLAGALTFLQTAPYVSERIGLVHVGQRQGPFYMPQPDGAMQRDCSEETAREIDQEVKKVLDEAHTEAQAILTDHRDKLDLIARELLKRETLDAEAFKALLGEPANVDGNGKAAPPDRTGSAETVLEL